MQIQEFKNDFDLMFANYPIQFSDTADGDGSTTSFRLTFAPIMDVDPYDLDVYVANSLRTEGTHYTVDRLQGIVVFKAGFIPVAGTNNIRFEGYYAKCNMQQWISYFNRAINKLNPVFPYHFSQEITYSMVPGAKEEDSVVELDLSQDPYDKWMSIQNIKQEIDDIKSVSFRKFGKKIRLSSAQTQLASGGIVDYKASASQSATKMVGSLSYPFHIEGHKFYPRLSSNPVTALADYCHFDHTTYDQALILIGLLMYEGRLHYTESLNNSTLRIFGAMELQTIIQSLNMQLFDGLRNMAPGKGISSFNERARESNE